MQEVTVFKIHEPYGLDLRFTSDGKTLITTGMDNLIKLWSTADWSHQATFSGHSKSANSIDLTPDETLLASGSSDQTIRLWSFPDGAEKGTLTHRKQTVAAVKFSPDGTLLASCWYGGYVAVWSVAEQAQVAAIRANKRHETSLTISPDSKVMATSGLGDALRLWTLPAGAAAGELTAHKGAVWGLKFLDGGSQLMSVGYEGNVIIWDMATQQALKRFAITGQDPRGVIVSPDESLVAIPMQNKVELRQLADWSLLEALPVSTKVVHATAFAPDGQTVVASGGDGKLRVWRR